MILLLGLGLAVLSENVAPVNARIILLRACVSTS